MRPPALGQWLADWRRFGLAVGIFVFGHWALRLALSPNLGRDAVEEALAAQYWAWGYHPSNPPLHTWLLRLLEPVLGQGQVAHGALHFGLLALALWGMRACGRRLGLAPATASLLALSPLLAPVLGWDALSVYTHSLAAAALAPWCLWALLGVLARPTGERSLLLGLVLGLGLLAKYSLLLFIPALLAAAMGQAPARPQRVAIAAAAAVAAALAAPAYLWLLAGTDRLALALADGLRPGGSSALDGLWALMLALSEASALLVFCCWVSWGLRRQQPSGKDGGASLPCHSRLLRHFFVLSLAAGVGLAVLFGLGGLSAHHLMVWVLLLPLWLALEALRGAPALSPQALRRLAGVLLLAILAAALALPLKWFTQAERCGGCQGLLPLQAIAADLQAAGFRGGMVVAADRSLGGGLIPFLPPGSTVWVPGALPQAPWPGSAEPERGRRGEKETEKEKETLEGSCVLIWPERQQTPATLPPVLAPLLAPFRARTVASGRINASRHPLRYGGGRSYGVNFLLLPTMETCR